MERNIDSHENQSFNSSNENATEEKNINQISYDEFSQDNKKNEKFEYKTNSLFFHFLSIFGVIFLSIFFIFQVYLTPITVVGQSMLPTINAKTTSDLDTSHCDVVYYREKSNYTYGDIVIISNQQDHYIDNSTRSKKIEFLIKRIIACPGDTITFYLIDISADGNKYYYDISVKNANGTTIELNEDSYIKEPMYLDKRMTNTWFDSEIVEILFDDTLGTDNRKKSITISENCYFAMGDNRNNSSDSRYFGEVNESDICGNVRLQVKFGENIWIALFKKLKSYLSINIKLTKEVLWEKNYLALSFQLFFCQ